MQKVIQTNVSTLDPLVSHCYISDSEVQLESDESIKDGIIWFGKDHGRRLFITGGSTSDIYIDGSWTRPFAKMMSNSEVTVLSSAVAGHSSVQEFLRLYRDGIPLLPRMVISLSGINDLGFIHSSSESPFLHKYQRSIYTSLVDKKRFSFRKPPRSISGAEVNGYNAGPSTHLSPFQFWLSNIKLMKAIADSIDATFISFLQPAMGVGGYTLSDEEKEHYREYCSYNLNYHKNASQFYSEASRAILEYPYIHSLVDLFNNQNDCYKDARHPNSKGNRLIAEYIYSIVTMQPSFSS